MRLSLETNFARKFQTSFDRFDRNTDKATVITNKLSDIY